MSRAQKAPVPAWLSDLQSRFGAVLRTPFAGGAEGARERSGRYDRELVAEITGSPSLPAAGQLAVYNRQYWFRLFRALQNEYALTARLLGYPTFNDHAQRFLLARPPRGHDIHDAADGFREFLGAAASEEGHHHGPVPRAALLEAATVDLAFQRLLYAPSEPVYRPAVGEVGRLAAARLRPSSRWTVLDEHWPLVELKRVLAETPGEDPLPLPPRLPAVRSWLVCNTAAGAMMVAPLPEQAAKLFRLLTRHRVEDALERLERDCPAAVRAQLPESVQRWLAQSVDLGFWSGVQGPPQPDRKDKDTANA